MKKLSPSLRRFALAAMFFAGLLFLQALAGNGPLPEGSMLKLGIAAAAGPTMVADLDITPPGCSAARPDVIKIGGYFYVHILKFSGNRQCFNLIKLDRDLKTVYSKDIYSGNIFPTDARLSVDDKGMLWYPFQTVRPQDQVNYLSIARYDVTSDPNRPMLLKSALDIAIAYPAQFPKVPAPGAELMDDPVPFFYKGRYCVATKTFSRPRLRIRQFNRDFELLESHVLDLENTVGRFFLSPNSLIDIDGGIFLITGIFNGGPKDNPNSISKIAAVPLTDDFNPKGPAETLTNDRQYSTYVSSAKYREGKLYVLYNIMTWEKASGVPGEGHIGMLGVYDPKSNFKLLNSIQINAGIMPDNHTSMEFSDDTLLVFYPTPSRRIMVKRLNLDTF